LLNLYYLSQESSFYHDHDSLSFLKTYACQIFCLSLDVLRCFLTFLVKVQPNVSYNNVSYKKMCKGSTRKHVTDQCSF